MRIEGKKFEFEDTIVWVFVMHSSVEMVTKRLYLQIGAQKKARFFSLMYFCESLCINRISHNYVIPQLVFCIIMPFRTSFHIPFRKLIRPFTLTVLEVDQRAILLRACKHTHNLRRHYSKQFLGLKVCEANYSS